MAIARAVAEYVHSNARMGCKTLFATHYHELTELADFLPRARNYSVAVSDNGASVVFLRMRRRVGLDSGPFPLSGKWPYGDAPKADNPL